jgi:hypothetical protein
LLQSAGEIRRVPETAADRQRYRYALEAEPSSPRSDRDATLAREPRLLLRWVGPRRRTGWRGGPASASSRPRGDRRARASAVDETRLCTPTTATARAGKPPKSPPVAPLVGSLDNLFHLGKLEVDHHAIVAGGGASASGSSTSTRRRSSGAHDRGPSLEGVDKAVAEMEAFARDRLGACRSRSTAPRAGDARVRKLRVVRS